jgi:hypothetical protein
LGGSKCAARIVQEKANASLRLKHKSERLRSKLSVYMTLAASPLPRRWLMRIFAKLSLAKIERA